MHNKRKNKPSPVQMMETGNVKKTLMTLGIPAIVATLITAIYNLVDTMFIGQLNDTAAMSAVAIAFPLTMIMSAIGQMVGVGASSYLSRMLGNKRQDLVDKTATIAVVLAIGLGLLTTIGGLLCLKPILTMMGASDTVLPVGVEYTKWLFMGSVFTIGNMVLSGLVRAEGSASYSMRALIVGAIINIVLDPIMMFGFGWGIAGASIATVLSQICSTVYLASYYRHKKGVVEIDFKKLSKKIGEDREIYLQIFKIGLPVFLMQFLFSIGSSLLNNAAMPYGDAAVAAIGIANRVYMIPIYIIAGFIQGFQPFAAYHYGGSLYKRLNEGIRFTFLLLIGFGIVCTVGIVAVPELFVGMFTQDPEVMLYGSNALTAMSILYPIVSIILIVTAIFQGMGKAKESAIISIARQGFVLIPMALILPRLFELGGAQLGFITSLFPGQMPDGLYGVVLTQPISDTITALIALVICVRPFKELRQLEKHNS